MVRFAVICASNQNRSMEAHDVLKYASDAKLFTVSRHAHCSRGRRKKGFDVCSYGTGSQVKLPGTAPDRPNVYSFGKPYRQIYEDLAQKDESLCVVQRDSVQPELTCCASYRQSGLLGMLERNWRIKEAPERFKDAKGPFDVIICCEERCYEAVCEGACSARRYQPADSPP